MHHLEPYLRVNNRGTFQFIDEVGVQLKLKVNWPGQALRDNHPIEWKGLIERLSRRETEEVEEQDYRQFIPPAKKFLLFTE